MNIAGKQLVEGMKLTGEVEFNLFGPDGKLKLHRVMSNLVVTVGKQQAMNLLGNTNTPTAFSAIAIGIGTSGPSAGDTALGSEIVTDGGTRGAATVTNTTTTTTGDTEQFQKTFSFTTNFAVTEEGIFDNNVSGGNLLARNVFSAINVANGDSLQVTHKIKAA